MQSHQHNWIKQTKQPNLHNSNNIWYGSAKNEAHKVSLNFYVRGTGFSPLVLTVIRLADAKCPEIDAHTIFFLVFLSFSCSSCSWQSSISFVTAALLYSASLEPVYPNTLVSDYNTYTDNMLTNTNDKYRDKLSTQRSASHIDLYAILAIHFVWLSQNSGIFLD